MWPPMIRDAQEPAGRVGSESGTGQCGVGVRPGGIDRHRDAQRRPWSLPGEGPGALKAGSGPGRDPSWASCPPPS